MKLINNFKQGLIHGIGFLTILAIAGISYATFNDQISEVSSGNPLKASEYNKIIQKINAIDEEQLATARVSFDGTSCPGNICYINDKYNINQVIKNYTGNYTISFLDNMSTSNFSTIISHGNSSQRGRNILVSQDNSNVVIETRDETGNEVDSPIINIQIFGGK